MIRTLSTIKPAPVEVTHGGTRKLVKAERTKVRVLEAVGDSRDAVPLKASRFAAVLGHSESHESRIRSGQRMSPQGRAALAVYEAALEEGLPLERAGYSAAFIEVTLRAIAMWPELEKLSTTQLYDELRREVAAVETRANGVCNDMDADCLAGLPFDVGAMLDAHTQQAVSSTRITAILQVLAQREA